MANGISDAAGFVAKPETKSGAKMIDRILRLGRGWQMPIAVKYREEVQIR